MSEINFNKVEDKKIYMWPLYNNGRVDKIHSVTKRLENEIVFSKPTPEDKLKLLDITQNNREIQYTSRGIQYNSPLITPGSFFNALA